TKIGTFRNTNISMWFSQLNASFSFAFCEPARIHLHWVPGFAPLFSVFSADISSFMGCRKPGSLSPCAVYPEVNRVILFSPSVRFPFPDSIKSFKQQNKLLEESRTSASLLAWQVALLFVFPVFPVASLPFSWLGIRSILQSPILGPPFIH